VRAGFDDVRVYYLSFEIGCVTRVARSSAIDLAAYFWGSERAQRSERVTDAIHHREFAMASGEMTVPSSPSSWRALSGSSPGSVSMGRSGFVTARASV